jgi:hypothetical protein
MGEEEAGKHLIKDTSHNLIALQGDPLFYRQYK